MILSIIIVVVINILGLIWCYSQQSDKATDLIYSLSFFILTTLLWGMYADSLAHHLMFGMIALWSIRLGFYLFKRIHVMGQDNRFEQMRSNFVKIAGFWFLQTGSILILAIPIIVLFNTSNITTHFLHILGAFIWLLGWLIESIADYQKFTFRQNKYNKDQFVNIGLWKQLQHPNYFGEILCWAGVFIITIPSLRGWEWLATLSPIWISLLLVFVSGIPLLQKGAKRKYGHLESYRKYNKNTPLLVPFFW